MDDYLENLTGAIHIEGSAELMAELSRPLKNPSVTPLAAGTI